ncbi:MAG: ATP-binding protein [Candidatus Nanoarchaeia archaeon]|nr:ATP-binding protein [Candidatus Haiyanarchaeum thermophilum]MCW1302887.1 ATP-binding protein [Candidatus Haiyanarchaeum thermophilum]MCW1303566.1 ATP-binding protein [Candidatus Haiyanarchaeum thermophilum]MCW1306248.1 ATP-binding protein [Candidatus Haiyanarchaeum thermophilum]MCW1307516.1 ATP-binding protein [Candidatus Haiyanarchaeum thermophilum]
MENPFLEIVASGEEEIVGSKFKEFLEKVKKEIPKLIGGERIILIVGEPGSGKSLIIKKITKDLRRKKVEVLSFSPRLIDDLRNVREKEAIVIENFHLIEALNPEETNKIIELILELTNAGVTFIVEASPSTVQMLKKLGRNIARQLEIFEVPKLTQEDLYEFILSKLRKVRGKKIKDIEPFTKEDVAKIWEKSKGNPRMAILLAQVLYDIKLRS